MPALKQIGITVDCPDVDQLAEFWERCLGYAWRPGAPGGPYVTLERVDGCPDGPPVVTFQTVPEPKTSKARIHLDLFVDHASLSSTRCEPPAHRLPRARRQASGRRGCFRTQRGTSSASSDPTSGSSRSRAPRWNCHRPGCESDCPVSSSGGGPEPSVGDQRQRSGPLPAPPERQCASPATLYERAGLHCWPISPGHRPTARHRSLKWGRRILGCDRRRALARRCLAAVDRGGRGDDPRAGPRRARGPGASGLTAAEVCGTVRAVRPERGALPSCERVVGAGPPAAQPVAVAAARRGGGVGVRGRGPRRRHHRGDRRGVGRSRVRQRVPGRARRGGDALRDPPRRRRRRATASRRASRSRTWCRATSCTSASARSSPPMCGC